MSYAPVAIGFRPAALLALVITAFLATDPSASQEKTAPKPYRDHQVPAGTYLAIELRTEMSSNSSRRADEIEGRLLRAVSNDGVELLPQGSVVRGTVREVEPAGKKKPGRIVFSFHVVEHPETEVSRPSGHASSNTSQSHLKKARSFLSCEWKRVLRCSPRCSPR